MNIHVEAVLTPNPRSLGTGNYHIFYFSGIVEFKLCARTINELVNDRTFRLHGMALKMKSYHQQKNTLVLEGNREQLKSGRRGLLPRGWKKIYAANPN